MKKYIGFDVDDKKTVTCMYGPERDEFQFERIPTELEKMRRYLAGEKKGGHEVHVTFEVSGQAGYLYDGLVDCVDSITVSNPTKMTWIYRTKKKNDRMDAKKQAVLLAMENSLLELALRERPGVRGRRPE